MKLFDSHCHLDDRSYKDDLMMVIKNAKTAGVENAMVVGINKESSAKALSIAKANPGYYSAVGVHPHEAKKCSEQVIEFLTNLAKSEEVKAWGEIGLDFNRMYSSQKDQEKWFIRQLIQADKLGLPVIFHERDTNGRFLEILKSEPLDNTLKGVVHCFSGTRNELMDYLDLGLYIGITGIITIKGRGAKLRELASLIPTERLLVETDAPYLTPAPQKNRGRRNEPAFVKSVMLKLAQVRQDDPNQLAEIIWENTCRLFGISF